MGRVTRNSNGTTRALPPGTHQENGGGGGRKTLIKGTGKKKGQEVKNSPNGDGGRTEDPETEVQTTIFDFPSQVPFDYTPRQSGFGTVLEIMKNGNDSVKEKVLNECNLIFECRCCNNLFRSPRDFLTHKDKHCTGLYEKISPAGLNELLRLAHNSFKINQDIPPNNQRVSIMTPVPSEVTKSNGGGGDLGGLSLDVNHLVPLLTTSLLPSSQKIQKELEPKELELLTDTVGQRSSGVLQTTRQLPRGFNGEVRIVGKYKSLKTGEETALVGADGKTAVMGKPSEIQLIVDKLTAQLESKREEEKVRENNLKCSTCQMVCGSEKALRIHSRQEHQQVRREKRRKTGEAVNGITKEPNVPLSDEPNPKSKGTSQNKKRLSSPIVVTPPESKVAKTESAMSSKSVKLVPPKEPKSAPRVPSFRRLTNNSFSATLSTSPTGSTMLPLGPEGHEGDPPPKRSKPSGKTKGSRSEGQTSEIEGTPAPEEILDYKAMAKALFPTEKRRSRRGGKVKKVKRAKVVPPSSPSSKRLACLMCPAQFGDEKEMSAHLGNCHHSQNGTGSRIGIIDRHDYIKTTHQSSSTTTTATAGREDERKSGGQKVKESTPVRFFNNNENEIEKVVKRLQSVQQPSTSQNPPISGSSSPSLCTTTTTVEPPQVTQLKLASPVMPSRIKMPELIPADRA